MSKQIILIISLLISVPVFADNWETLVQKLTQTRVDVEALSKDIDVEQREKQSELDQWLNRKTDLDAQLQREKMRELQLEEKLKRLESRVKVQGKVDPQAQKKLLTWISQYENWVQSTIPFLQDVRIESLNHLKVRAQNNHEAMEFILSDFWAFVESEMKLAQTNEYRIVDVEISGAKRKCEVARLGLQSLFVVTPDKQILKAVKETKSWVWKNIDSTDEKSSILSLVKNLKEKNDSGYYLLPVDKGQMGASL